MKQFYVFKDPEDPTCPIVIHFVLANRTFKEQLKPGIAPTCFFVVVVVVVFTCDRFYENCSYEKCVFFAPDELHTLFSRLPKA